MSDEKEKQISYPHEWVKSTLGHGESMCAKCFITNREAAVLGRLNDCKFAERKQKANGEG